MSNLWLACSPVKGFVRPSVVKLIYSFQLSAPVVRWY